MNVKILELNDSELRFFADEKLLISESGFVRIHKDNTGHSPDPDNPPLEFGDAARREIRRNPRQVNMQHWHRLNMDPLANPSALCRNQADLVFRQLQHLAKAADLDSGARIILAAPACTSAEQLGLLLGIAREADIAICGIVDSQLAAVCAHESSLPEHCQVVDLSLFSGTITTLARAENLASRDCKTLPEMGLNPLLDGWVSVVADRFLNETRFDPLRIADTEQQVFDQVYEWLHETDRPREVTVQVRYQGIERQVEMSPDQLQAKAAQRYALLVNTLEPGLPLLLSHRASRLPGLQATLAAAGHRLTCLQERDLAIGVRTHQKEILSDPDELRFVTQFALSTPADEPAHGTGTDTEAGRTSPRGTESEADTLREPTHLLCDGYAVSISNDLRVASDRFPSSLREKLNGIGNAGLYLQYTPEGVVLKSSLREPETSDLTLNGRPVPATSLLTIGDELVIGSQKFLLIRVEDGA